MFFVAILVAAIGCAMPLWFVEPSKSMSEVNMAVILVGENWNDCHHVAERDLSD